MRNLVVVMSVVVVMAMSGAACGGKSKSADTTTAGTAGDRNPASDDDSGGDMVPPERMDEITAALSRKRNAAARCLADAVNRGAIDKNARGHVALGFVIGADGHARDVKVVETSLDSPVVEQCVIEKVQSIDFGTLPKALEWSYAYAFESM
jgi:hypothetical protein